MFTGLVESIGTVRRCVSTGRGQHLEVEVTWPDKQSPQRGDSVAINGACLTALDDHPARFSADVSPESLSVTLLGELRNGDSVNVERALRLGDRIGGHLVQGHVDTIVRLLSIRQETAFARFTLSLPEEIAPEVARKGSVTLDGVSLTVASLTADSFDVALIPETLRATTLQHCRAGSRLHLETDVIAKYVGRRLAGKPTSLIDQVFGGTD